MASDGFADQMGGKTGRKFGTKRLKNLLKEIRGESFEKQKEILLQAYEAHRGGNERQDDMTVAGVGF